MNEPTSSSISYSNNSKISTNNPVNANSSLLSAVAAATAAAAPRRTATILENNNLNNNHNNNNHYVNRTITSASINPEFLSRT